MTENEEKAVKFIKNIRDHAVVTLDHIEKEEPNVSPLVFKEREEKADTILKMLDELRQYRSLGTPEELQDMKNNYFAALSDWRHYRKIGTVEECRAAMEKQTAKKIKQQQWMYTKCDCGYEFSKHHGDGYYSIPQEQKTKYCPNCGQKLDWNSEE